MLPSTRTKLAELCLAVGSAIAFITWFFADQLSWPAILVCLGSFVGSLLLGAKLIPPFWWGKRRFTTPLIDPSHSASAMSKPANEAGVAGVQELAAQPKSTSASARNGERS